MVKPKFTAPDYITKHLLLLMSESLTPVCRISKINHLEFSKEQKYLYVDYYAKWKIKNLALYYTRTGGYSENAKQLLTQKINDALRAEFGKRNLQEVVADQRSDIMGFLRDSANFVAQGLGLEIVGVQIKSIDLMPEVQDSVFKSMSTKREQDATTYRSSGFAESERIRAEADATAIKMIADANKMSAEIRAKGDEKAANIYTTAYQKDPEFMLFIGVCYPTEKYLMPTILSWF